MRSLWISAAVGSAMGLTVSGHAIAQQPAANTQGQYEEVPRYDTPLYVPSAPPMLEKNFSLPTFGMQGAGLPQQRTQAPEPVQPDPPDVFKRPPDYALPRAQEWTPGGTKMETPSYTTAEGLAAGDTDDSETGGFGTRPVVRMQARGDGFLAGDGQRREPATGQLETGQPETGPFGTDPPGGR